MDILGKAKRYRKSYKLFYGTEYNVYKRPLGVLYLIEISIMSIDDLLVDILIFVIKFGYFTKFAKSSSWENTKEKCSFIIL